MKTREEISRLEYMCGPESGEKWDLSDNDRKAIRFALDELATLKRERDDYREAIKMASRWLDGIKFELYASVYTLEDDEFEKTFAARDVLDSILAKHKPGDGGMSHVGNL